MFVRNILATGALLSLATAVPLQHEHQHLHLHAHEKRDVVWTTSVVEEFVTAVVTTTVFGPPPTPGAGSNLQHRPHGPDFGPRPTRTSHIFQTVTVQPQPAAPSGAPPAGTQPPAVPDASPAPSQPAPMPSQPAPAPPSAAPAAPSAAPQPSAQPMPSAPPAPAPSSPPSGGGGSGGGQFTGDITYYTPGLGSCGITNTESDHIVALAAGMMEQSLAASGATSPNDNPLCGKSITISYGGKTAQATIEDTCPGCSGASLDLTPSLFEVFGDLSIGRISGVSWSYN